MTEVLYENDGPHRNSRKEAITPKICVAGNSYRYLVKRYRILVILLFGRKRLINVADTNVNKKNIELTKITLNTEQSIDIKYKTCKQHLGRHDSLRH